MRKPIITSQAIRPNDERLNERPQRRLWARIMSAGIISLMLYHPPSRAADFTVTDESFYRLFDQLELRGLVDPAPLYRPLAYSHFRQLPDSVKQTGIYRGLSRRMPFSAEPQARFFSALDGWLAQDQSRQAAIGHFRGGLLMGSGPWSLVGTYDGLSGDDFNQSYYGYRWRGVRAKTDQVYLRWSGERAFFQVGKDYLRYGLGMGLSGNAPFEKVQAGISLGPYLSLHSFTGKLDGWLKDSVFVNRFLAGHRVQLNLGFLQLGLSEFAIYGGPGRTCEPYYLLPLYIFLGEQDNRQIDDNIIWDLDFKVTTPPVIISGEIMIDDFQIEDKSASDKEPTEAGLGIQIAWAVLSKPLYLTTTLSYKMITSWTFNQNKDWNRFILEGQPIGPPEGNDFDLASWDLAALSGNWDAGAKIYLKRRGQGRIDDPWTSPWIADSAWTQNFPSGVVERTAGLQIGMNYRLPGFWFSGPRRQASLLGQFTYENINNYGHLAEINRRQWQVKLGLGFDYSRVLVRLD